MRIPWDSPRLNNAVAEKYVSRHAYFDLTSGINLYSPATPGWVYTTGLGSPNLANFDQAVSNMLASP